MYGYDHPGDPIGPEPSHQDTPDQRAAWHEAFLALGPASGPDVRAMPDGRLWLIRDTYAAETAWAPRHVGKELRLARLGAFDAGLGAIRAAAEADAARKAGDHDRAARHETLAASYRALRDHYQQREQALAQAMADRQEWEQATAGSRHLAIAADAELRRRHPGQKIEPLRSAEPAPASDTEREHLHPAPDGKPAETASWIRDPAYAAPGVPRRDRRTPAADGAWRRPGSGRPRQGLPWLAGIRPGCDLAAAQTGDHPLGEDPPARRRARHRTRPRSRGLSSTSDLRREQRLRVIRRFTILRVAPDEG